jgi:hypothetical protein
MEVILAGKNSSSQTTLPRHCARAAKGSFRFTIYFSILMGLSINAVLASALAQVGRDAPLTEKSFKISCKEDLRDDGYNSDLGGDTYVGESDSDDNTPWDVFTTLGDVYDLYRWRCSTCISCLERIEAFNRLDTCKFKIEKTVPLSHLVGTRCLLRRAKFTWRGHVVPSGIYKLENAISEELGARDSLPYANGIFIK